VRLEVATALTRAVRVIPVLVERANMPAERDLPDNLRAFSRRNALELRDTSWERDVARLVQVIEREFERTPEHPSVSPAPLGAGLRWRRVLTGLAVVAGLALVIGLGRSWLWSSPPAPSAPAPPPSPSGTTPQHGGKPVSIPTPARTILFGAAGDHVIYEILSGRLDPGSGAGRRLALSVRMTNNATYGQNFGDDAFRLLVDGVSSAPVSEFNETVPGGTVKDGVMTFEVPGAVSQTALRISLWGKTATIALGDLRRVSVPSAPPAERTRRLDAEITLGPMVYRIATATLEPFSDRRLLRLAVRATNREKYGQNFTDDSFRLLVNGLPQAPVSGINEVVAGESAREGTLTFELPERAPAGLVLRVRYGGKTADVRLD
jgi:hypothetical protein